MHCSHGHDSSDSECRFASLCGLLGYGFPADSLAEAMRHRLHFLGVDAGSTDPGPYYLGSGTSFVKDSQIRRDLTLALPAARQAGIPLIIGTAGGSGAKPHVDHFLDLLEGVADDLGSPLRIAVVRTDLPAQRVAQACREGRLRPCGMAPEAEEDAIRQCTQLVAQVGVDPIIEALQQDVDVVVAGRCCDTAVFAAFPIMQGCDPGLALHAAKIAECGTLCATPGGANDALIVTLRNDYFEVRPADAKKRCTPETVAAHSLYEQPSPHCFLEPEGTVDLTASRFEQVDPCTVRVSGSRLIRPDQPCIKIEGARRVGARALTIAGTCDPRMIAHLDDIEAAVRERVAAAMAGGGHAPGLSLRFLRYGLDAVTGRPLADTPPAEVGLVIEAVAPDQDTADTAVSLARSTCLHQPFEGRKTTAGNLAFPFSPSDIQAGDVYEFAVYHLLDTLENDPPLWSLDYVELGS